MGKVNIQLAIGLPTGRSNSGSLNIEWYPKSPLTAFEPSFIHASGGSDRRIYNDSEIKNEMVIGDELCQAKFLGNLVIADEPNGSLEHAFYLAPRGARFSMAVRVAVKSGYVTKVMVFFMNWCWIEQTAYGPGKYGEKRWEAKINFSPNHTRLDTSTIDLSYIQLIKKAEETMKKMIADGASNVGNTVNSAAGIIR